MSLKTIVGILSTYAKLNYGILLCDEYQYLYPKRNLSIDLEDYIDKTLQRAIRLDKLKNNEPSKKQHLDPRGCLSLASKILSQVKIAV
ncbi:hypothetical protein HZC88_00470 [Klebsiella pneumoniae]|uniref:hypothetical protein n=1 Tax=Klebsiella pneumoniae TaxID=573 RepID=UPI001EFB5598|nr:hypothetical protein [Klebsiella pneumoniae]ULN02369.1 hypothetical protein HZC88_00470 [Klebsiella pneumoniae]